MSNQAFTDSAVKHGDSTTIQYSLFCILKVIVFRKWWKMKPGFL